MDTTCILTVKTHIIQYRNYFSGTTDCKNGPLGLDYDGAISQTKTGLECQCWSRQVLNHHKYPNETENYCRNPDRESGGSWCYVNNASNSKRWELCDIPICGRSSFGSIAIFRLSFNVFSM